jgi:cell division septation protein DedD
MKIEVSDASEYVAAIPEGRRPHVEAVRKLVRRVAPKSTERVEGGRIYFAYRGRAFAAVASEKSSLALYLIELDARPDLVKRYQAGLAGLDIGSPGCIRFQEVDELPIDVIADVLRETPAAAVTAKKTKAVKPSKKAATKKTAAKAKPAKKTTKAKAKKKAPPSKKRAK